MQDLTWWQGLGLLLAAVAAFFGGQFIGTAIHRVIYRRVLMATDPHDERFLLRLGGPLQALASVGLWQVFVTFFDLARDVLGFCRAIGHVGLLAAIAWGVIRGLDVVLDLFAPRWMTNQQAARSLVPLASRIAKVVVGGVITLMALDRLGFAIGPLLVLFAIVGAALALAAVRPLENVLSAYALMSDHGIREGDSVRLDARISGVIESIGLYSTRIRTADSSQVIVPNRRLADAEIERAFHRTVTRPLGVVSPTNGHTQTTRESLS
jgi:MscS family membrane protein